MDISNQCRPGWGYPNFQKLNHGYLQQVLIRIGISQTSKIKSWISLICAEQIWYIPKTEKIYLWSANIIWFIHGIACDNQTYPWYTSEHWYYQGYPWYMQKHENLSTGIRFQMTFLFHPRSDCDKCSTLRGRLVSSAVVVYSIFLHASSFCSNQHRLDVRGIAERLVCSLTHGFDRNHILFSVPVGTFSSAPGNANPETGSEGRRALYADSLEIETPKDLHIA